MKKNNKNDQAAKPLKTALTRVLFSAFYERNKVNLALAILFFSLSATAGAIVSWILAEVIDIIASGSGEGLGKIVIITGIFLPGIFLVDTLAARFKSRFTHRGIRQYKDKAFSLLTTKGIGAFLGEKTSGYISALTNDATSIEDNYLSRSVELVYHILSFCFEILFCIQ